MKWTKSKDFSKIDIGWFLKTCNLCTILLHVDDQALFLGPLSLQPLSHFKNNYICDLEKAL